MAALAFTDLVSNQRCELVIPPGGRVYPGPGEPKIGVAHPGCPAVADLAVELDAFWCPACGWNGRVSGAWCVDMIRAGRSLRTRDSDLILLPFCGARLVAAMQVRHAGALR